MGLTVGCTGYGDLEVLDIPTAMVADEIGNAPSSLEDDMPAIPDRRLELMLVCAHPAIAPNIRTPLMLQTVLGVEAAAVAAAFAVEPATMAQRLVRAKKRIRDAGIPFVLPERADLAARLPAVLEAVYGAYAIDWQLTRRGRRSTRCPLRRCIWRWCWPTCFRGARSPGPGGARVPVRVTAGCATHRGRRFVPLDEQDTARWDTALIERGESLLRRAHDLGRPDRFQYEAAIQSAHCSRARTGRVDSETLRKLYRAVLRVAPSLGAAVAAAAIEGEIDGPDAGLLALDAIADPAVSRFQPAWSARAHLLAAAGRRVEAVVAYRRAIELTKDSGLADYLLRKLKNLSC